MCGFIIEFLLIQINFKTSKANNVDNLAVSAVWQFAFALCCPFEMEWNQKKPE